MRKEFFYKQVNVYEKLTQKVGTMVFTTSRSLDSLRKLLNDYELFRFGEYSLYTTDSVEKYARTFYYYFDRYIRNDEITKTDLEVIAFKLYNECRLSLNQTLEVHLKQVEFRENLK